MARNSTQEKSYAKRAILKSGEFNKDIVNTLFEDGKMYTKSEVRKRIDKFMKGGVC